MEILKRMVTKWKLKKWKLSNPSVNINPATGEKLLEELHVVVFINGSFPKEDQMTAMAGCVATWFYNWGSSPISQQWETRKSSPTIFQIKNTEEMNNLRKTINMEKSKKTVFTLAGEPVAICIGPVWTNQIIGYNNTHRKLSY